eukprot:1148253-Pleurochrysis_carterae.AAC.1
MNKKVAAHSDADLLAVGGIQHSSDVHTGLSDSIRVHRTGAQVNPELQDIGGRRNASEVQTGGGDSVM